MRDLTSGGACRGRPSSPREEILTDMLHWVDKCHTMVSSNQATPKDNIMSTNTLTIDIPAYTADDNFAEVITAEFLGAHGGTDITGRYADDADYGTWAGDVEIDGVEYRLRIQQAAGRVAAVKIV